MRQSSRRVLLLAVAHVLGGQFSQYLYSSDDCSGDRQHSAIFYDGKCTSFTNGTAKIFICEPGGSAVFSYEFSDQNCKTVAIAKNNVTDLFGCQIGTGRGSLKWKCEYQP
jgi:hypothetical protein